MADELIPTLDSAGWVGELKKKADKIVSWFFLTQKSQTNIFYGRVSSLPALVQASGSKPTILCSDIKSALDTILARYFKTFTVSVDRTDPDNTGMYGITVEVEITEAGTVYSLGRLISVTGSKINNIVKINNG